MSIKYTYSDIKNFVEVESNSGCKLLSTEWTNNKTKMKFTCKCGNEFETNMNGFRSGGKRQCNVCAEELRREKRMFSFEQVRHFIEDNSKCKLLSTEYKGQNKKMKFKCNCGNEFEATFDAFKNANKRQCNDCGKKILADSKRNSYTEVKSYIESYGCKLLSNQYINQDMELLIQCHCGNKFKTTFSNFKHNNVHHCKKCSSELVSKNRRLNIDEVINFINDNGCKYISGEYKNQKSKLLLQCPCGNLFKTSYVEFKTLNKRQCNDCGKAIRIKAKTRSNKEFQKEVRNQVSNEYEFLQKYEGARTKIRVRHNICGNVYDVTPDNFLRGKRCPFCNESKNENFIGNLLNINNIKHERQYIFEELIGLGGGLLRFDFAIFDDEDKTDLKCLIEYDGEFHYKKYFEEQNFEIQKIHDKMKDDYCKENNIELIRIPYWECSNIEKILQDNLIIKDLEEAM